MPYTECNPPQPPKWGGSDWRFFGGEGECRGQGDTVSVNILGIFAEYLMLLVCCFGREKRLLQIKQKNNLK